MSETKKMDTKKLLIILIPVVIGLVIYTFFFKSKSEAQVPKTESILIPDSKTEDVPASKSEIYAQEKKTKLAKLRESENSDVSSQAFFDAVSKNEKDPELVNLSEEEKLKKFAQAFPSESKGGKNQHPKNNAFLLEDPSPNRWKVDDVENKLEQYDYEKELERQSEKTSSGRSNSSSKKKVKSPENVEAEPESIPETKVEKEIITTPGKRTRNNSLASESTEMDGNMIPAVIHGDQTITNGATVKMRLLQDIIVEGEKIPKNTFVYGIARFNTERVNIQLKAIRLNNSQIKFPKTVIDKDGIEGLYFPDNLGNEMKKEIGGSALDEAYDIATSGTGTVGSVLKAGKSILKRKNVERKVTLKSNYNIYLK